MPGAGCSSYHEADAWFRLQLKRLGHRGWRRREDKHLRSGAERERDVAAAGQGVGLH